jgi:hypothetical protein
VARIILIPDEGFEDADKKELRERMESEACKWCGGLHYGECPRLRHIIYHPSDERQVREVEFWPDGEWDRSRVLFAEDIV